MAIKYIKANSHMTYSVILWPRTYLWCKIRLCQFSNTSLQSTSPLPWSNMTCAG